MIYFIYSIKFRGQIFKFNNVNLPYLKVKKDFDKF